MSVVTYETKAVGEGIIESWATSGSGYRKFADGTMEQWLNVSVTDGIDNATGSIYRSDAISFGNWVTAFTILNTVSLGFVSISGLRWLSQTSTPSITSAGTGYILCSVSITSETYIISIHSTGTWR